jgi:beta-fructofuranosidase
MGFLYKPEDGVAGDFVPFYWAGEYHLFYLKDYRDPEHHGEGVPWFHLVTKDFVNFEERGEALPRGTADEPDLFVFTGSVFEYQGTFHIFYAGSNPYLRKRGEPEQVVLHATSPDLDTWHKDPDFALFAPTELGYEMHDWRDPFIFWNEQAREYWMLLAGRRDHGPQRQRGLTACLGSSDLKHWEIREPFWAPELYINHECPDLFRIGDWWYLLYSTYSERWVTHYRMSRTLAGPWLAPASDTFDARAFYAARTAGDGQKRYLFGWLPTRTNEKDDGDWNWGGHLVVHELVQAPDGLLALKLPASVNQGFSVRQPLLPRPVLGPWRIEADRLSGGAAGCGASLMLADLPDTCLVEAELDFSAETNSLGLLLRADPTLDHYYVLRFEPARQRMVFDRWPRPGDQPFMLEQPMTLIPGTPLRLQLLLDGTAVVARVVGQTALSSRMYAHRSGGLGLFVNEGEARFSNLSLATQS